jgi:hypothetical protein
MNVRRLTKKVMTSGVLAAVAVFSACDLAVTNPGPVQDATLNLEGAYQGIVNGAIRGVQEGFDQYALLGGAITHDVMASGHTGSAGVRPEEEIAALSDDYNGRGSWGALHRARWVAEEAVRRFTREDSGVSSDYPPLAQAHFWAGLASRYLGENACTAVFNGGAPEPKLAYMDYAVDAFDNAVTIGRAAGLSDMVTAAIGARAAAKLFKGDYAGASSDAQQVPLDFEWLTAFSGFGGEYFNSYGHVASLGFQSLSYWGTPAAEHFLLTGDSRVAFGYDNGSREVPSGKSAAVRGQTHPARPTWVSLIPMYYPLQAIAPRDKDREFLFFEPVRGQQRELQVQLVDGREMELIRAEVELRNGNWQAAMSHINNVRTASPVYPIDMTDQSKFDLSLHPDEQVDWNANADLSAYFDQFSYELQDFTQGNMMMGDRMMDPVIATNAEEAWTALKFERYVEFMMEGRRFGDRWRWRANPESIAPSSGPGGELTPGKYNHLEFIPPSLAKRYDVPEDPLMMCFPLPAGENDTNHNIDEAYADWIESTGYRAVDPSLVDMRMGGM